MKGLSSSQIAFLCQTLSPLLKGAIVKSCLSLDRWRLLFVWQLANGQEERLFFCLQPPFLRFHLLQKPWKEGASPHLSLHPFLAQATLEEISPLNEDRIIQLKFRQKGKLYTFLVEFFPKKPNYYLLDSNQEILFAFYPSPHSHYTLPSKPIQAAPETSPLLTHQEIESLYQKLEEQWSFQQAKGQVESALKQQIKRVHGREAKLKESLSACERWADWQHEGELLKGNFSQLKRGLHEIRLWDWEKEEEVVLKLDPAKTPQEEVAIRFRQSKKLQKGISHLQEQLKKIEGERGRLEALLTSLTVMETIEQLAPFKQQVLPSRQVLFKEEKGPSLPYREYVSEAGIPIWVGKNAKANEELTFRLARGSDWWLHVRDFPGSHVIIRTAKRAEPDPETLADAMQLALYYSRAKEQGSGEICLTQRKFVSRLGRGKKGQVQISKHKNLHIRADQKRYQALKERRGRLEVR